MRSARRADRAAAQRTPLITLHHLPPEPLAGPNCVAFGNFDGVHRGHQALLAQVGQRARELGGQAVAVTFDPHPLTLLRPHQAPRAIDVLPDRLSGLAQAGVDVAVVLRFDPALAHTSPTDFATRILFTALQARCVVIGHDTRFGHGGRGDAELLRQLAAEHRVQVQACAPVLWQGSEVSSSRVRRAIEAGEVQQAAALLTRPWRLGGPIVHGDHRGRTIGFATANLQLQGQVVPAHGVYACWLQRPSGALLPAVANCGVRPTFGKNVLQIEAHCLDFAGDLYGEEVRLHFVQRLRGELKFNGLDQLQAQIAADVVAARPLLVAQPLVVGPA